MLNKFNLPVFECNPFETFPVTGDEKLEEEPASDKAERLYKHVYETNEFRINYRLTRSRAKN